MEYVLPADGAPAGLQFPPELNELVPRASFAVNVTCENETAGWTNASPSAEAINVVRDLRILDFIIVGLGQGLGGKCNQYDAPSYIPQTREAMASRIREE